MCRRGVARLLCVDSTTQLFRKPKIYKRIDLIAFVLSKQSTDTTTNNGPRKFIPRQNGFYDRNTNDVIYLNSK